MHFKISDAALFLSLVLYPIIFLKCYSEARFKTHLVAHLVECLLKVNTSRWLLLGLIGGPLRTGPEHCGPPLWCLVLSPMRIIFLQNLPNFQVWHQNIWNASEISLVLLLRLKLQIRQSLCFTHRFYSGLLSLSLLFFFFFLKGKEGRKEGRWLNPSILIIKTVILWEKSKCVRACVWGCFSFYFDSCNPNIEL